MKAASGSPDDPAVSSAMARPGRQPLRPGSRRLYGGMAVCAGLIAALALYGGLSANLGNLNALGSVFMFIVLAQAWNILGGYGGYMNFGMAAFFGVGAYAAAILSRDPGAPPFLTVPAAGILTAVFGLLVSIPTLRLRGAYFAIATLIVTFAVQLAVYNMPFTQGALGIYLAILPFSPRAVEAIYYFGFLGMATAATLAVYVIEHSALGYALVAIREDEDASEILGVRTTRVKIAGLVTGALMAGVAGGVYAYRTLYIEPAGTFAIDTSLNVVLMAVLGGAGSWQGPVIGTAVIMLLADVLRVWIAAAANRVVFGFLLIAVALFVPNGVMGVISGVRGRRFTV